MGACGSKHPKVSTEEKRDTRKSATETKINQALLKKKMEIAVSDKPMSFERVLLKFDKLRAVLGYVKLVFQQVATDGKLDNEGLQAAMKRLNVNLTLDDLLDLFDFVDVQARNVITIKEFLVALTVGMVLDIIPALATPKEGGKVNPLRQSISGFLGHTNEVKEMLNLIVCAYLIFDPEGKGFIERTSVEKMLLEQGKAGKTNAMLSQQRWHEMVRLLFLLIFENSCE
jgi:Ca2+-binding EF-hand superfamily protein